MSQRESQVEGEEIHKVVNKGDKVFGDSSVEPNYLSRKQEKEGNWLLGKESMAFLRN